MAHKNWCGRPCWECSEPCLLDAEIPCSPDCIGLDENGDRKLYHCVMNGCDTICDDIYDLRTRSFV